MIERGNGRFGAGTTTGREPSIGELFGQLSNDASRLIQQELALAKAELRETAAALASALAACRHDANAQQRQAHDEHASSDRELVAQTWALNEASVEKAARERMIELVVEVDGRPLSRWGCDGVVLATPTGVPEGPAGGSGGALVVVGASAGEALDRLYAPLRTDGGSRCGQHARCDGIGARRLSAARYAVRRRW